MTFYECWQWLFAHWYCSVWQPIPGYIQFTLKLDSRMGMCHGQLVSKVGAQGIDEFVHRMNMPRTVTA